MGLYEVLKAAKIGAASDVFTTLRGQQAPFAKGGSTEHEYTGTVPYTFDANGSPLLDWYIKGNTDGVGERTENLFDYTVSESGTITSTGVLEPNVNSWRSTIYYEIDGTKTYRVSKAKDTIRICYYDSSKTFISREQITSENNIIITIPSGAKYIKWALYSAAGLPNLDAIEAMKIMLSEGSTALPYEPYGYKIPVICGDETNVLYIDNPLGASDSISMTDTGITIPTVDGSNTLSVGTTVQPSSVYIKYKE